MYFLMGYRQCQHVQNTQFLAEASSKKRLILVTSLLSGDVNKTSVFDWAEHNGVRAKELACSSKGVSHIRPKFNSPSSKFSILSRAATKIQPLHTQPGCLLSHLRF